MAEAVRSNSKQHIVVVSGPAGSGRSTAIGALEDLGFEAIDNLPISFVPRLFSGGSGGRAVVVGIDPRNRDFTVARLLLAIAEIEAETGVRPTLVYLDCDAATLLKRYGETRRRHPLSRLESPIVGIERELELLAPLRARADLLVDTRTMAPRELRAEMSRYFGEGGRHGGLVIMLQSFSYKRGVPWGTDMVIDVRFLRNPHWDQRLRPLDGRDPEVRQFIEADPAYAPFYARLVDLVVFLLPAYRAEGKSYFGLGLGCTGGKHRSVALIEALAKSLADGGWQVSIRHRDLEPTAGDVASGLGVGIA
ncbi:MAG: RNase adapter RapZ [Amaricoccus sp.]